MLRYLIPVLAVIAVGCAGRSSDLPAQGARGLPPLPQDAGQVNGTPPVRGSSAAVEVVIGGSAFFAKNEDSMPTDGTLELIKGSASFPWAIYALAGVAPDYAPTSLSVTLAQTQAEYFVALANYSAGQWQFYEAQTGVQELAVGDIADYTSPGGNFYFAVLVGGDQAITLEQCSLTLEDTRPLAAPDGLSAQARDASVSLEWQAYGDSRADELRIYRSSQVTMDGAVLDGSVQPEATTYTAQDLTNGTKYYFALKAYWAAEPVESDYSNVVSATPQQAGTVRLSGVWPRLGNLEDNRGSTDNVGPPSFATWVSVEMAPAGTKFQNRTTPVIGDDGSVFALSADAVLHKFSADLSTEHWVFPAKDHGTPGGIYMCPPHSPIVDSEGNCYFIAAPDASPGAVPYVFSVTPEGGLNWRFDAVAVDADVDSPYPSPNITPDGNVIAFINHRQLLVGIDSSGSEAWNYDFAEAREVHANPAISSRGTIEMPVWFSGIGIDPREHWISLDVADGGFLADYKGFGGPANIFSGLPLPGPYHVYPEQASLVLLNPVNGAFISSIAMVEPLTSSPARSTDSSYIFQAHAPYGFSGRGDMRCYQINESLPEPALELVFIQQLNEGSLTSQPAVDVRNTIFVPDGQGVLYRIEFDKTKPIGAGNPVIADSEQLNPTDTYRFNSFALGVETAYIIAENNTLYCIWNALD